MLACDSDDSAVREDSSLDDHDDAILDDIAVLLLIGLLHVGAVDDLAVAANTRVLVDDALPHRRVGACIQSVYVSPKDCVPPLGTSPNLQYPIKSCRSKSLRFCLARLAEACTMQDRQHAWHVLKYLEPPLR